MEERFRLLRTSFFLTAVDKTDFYSKKSIQVF